MSNRNNPDPEQDEQERLEQEQREQQLLALRGKLRQPPDDGTDDPGEDASKNPVIINR